MHIHVDAAADSDSLLRLKLHAGWFYDAFRVEKYQWDFLLDSL